MKFTRRVTCFVMRSEGFSGRAARRWTRLVERNRKFDDGFSRSEKDRAHKWGFMPEDVKTFGVTEQNRGQFVSQRRYMYLHPMNGKYDKWVRDRISALKVFSDFTELFETHHFHIVNRAGRPLFIGMSQEAHGVTPDLDGLRKFLVAHGSVSVLSSTWRRGNDTVLSADVEGEGFVFNGERMSFGEFREWLEEELTKHALVIVDANDESAFDHMAPGAEISLLIRVLNRNGAKPKVVQPLMQVRYSHDILDVETGALRDIEDYEGDDDEGSDEADDDGRFTGSEGYALKYYAELKEDGSFESLIHSYRGNLQTFEVAPGAETPFVGKVENWDLISEKIVDMCRIIPQVEFVEFEVRPCAGGFAIIAVRPSPLYNKVVPFPAEVVEYLLAKAEQKHDEFVAFSARYARFMHNLRLKIRRTYSSFVAPKGLVPYQSTRWVTDVFRDLVSKTGMPLKDKMWAYKHGFLSYRLGQYGITEDNWKNYISDFEYRWLRHINSKYKYWLEDKITLKYIASDFKECFPGYYYYTSLKDGANCVIPMMDAPKGYEATYEDIVRLAKEMKILALKPDEGSHGEGFYKLVWDGESFYLNDEAVSEERVLSVLQDPKNQYLVTEYIQMHPQLKEIYPGSVNTIRVTVFKKDGRTPVIGNAYMRIGSSRTGFVDNLAAGGICAAVDVETGRYGDAQILDGIDQGNLVPCPVHPDTGVPIEGVLPNWEYAKQRIYAIADSISQLEYFGFDLAITEDGIKLPEINRFPDFPRIDKLTPETIDYLLHRLNMKKRVYGYDKNPCKSLLRLPRR